MNSNKMSISDNDLLDEMFLELLEETPTEEEFFDYLNDNCSGYTKVRLEEHFVINPDSRLKMGILIHSKISEFLNLMVEKKSITDLLLILKDKTESYWIKGLAIRSLAKLNAGEAVDDFIDILSDINSHPWLVDNAAEGLAKMKERTSLSLLKKFLTMDNADTYVKEFVTEAISEMERPLRPKLSEKMLEIIRSFVGSTFSYGYSLNPVVGRGSPKNDIDFVFEAENGNKCYGFISETEEKDIEINIYFNRMELEGGIITVKAENDLYKNILFKQRNKVGTTIIISEDKRKTANISATLEISNILLTEQITETDLADLADELNKMMTGSENQRAAAEKILNHIKSSN